MKIVHVTNFYKPSWESGGVTRVAYHLTKELAKKGHEVVVLTTDGFKKRLNVETGKPVMVDGVKVYYFKNLSMWLASKNITIPLKSKKIIQKEIADCDVVHIHEHRSLLARSASKAALKYKKPYLIQPHGSIPTNIGRTSFKKGFDLVFGNKIIGNANRIIAITSKEENELKHYNQTIIIPIGFDASDNDQNIKRGEFRKKMKISKSDFLILYIGRLHKIKGLDILIKSCKELKSINLGFKVIIAGPDDGFKNKLVKMIENNNLEDIVKIISPIYGKDKSEAFIDADLFILPSRYETFPVVVLEAAYHNLPVVISKKCGIQKEIDEVIGVSINLKSRDIASAIIHLSTHFEIREKFENNCRLFSLGYSWENQIVKYINFYNELVK